jgi:hypothetical protein
VLFSSKNKTKQTKQKTSITSKGTKWPIIYTQAEKKEKCKTFSSLLLQVSFGGWFLIRLGSRKSYFEAAGK